MLLGPASLLAVRAADESTFDFTASDITGALLAPEIKDADGTVPDFPDATEETADTAYRVSGGTVLTRQEFTKKGNVIHTCGCSNAEYDDGMTDYQQFRTLSDRYLNYGRYPSRRGWSNAVWSWGQFIDHDVVATVDVEGGDDFDITLSSYGQTATMTLHRLFTEPEDGAPKCRSPINVISPQIDGSMVYGSDEAYLNDVLREPESCRLRTSPGELLPVTTDKDAANQNRFLAGDGRVNEHAILTAMHTVWMREHNRLCEIANDKAAYAGESWDVKFEAVRKVVIAKLQHITVKHFLPTLGISETELEMWEPTVNKPDMSIEFSIAYRFGHDLIPDNVGAFAVKDIFNGEKFFSIKSADGSSDPEQVNSKMDSVMDALVSNRAMDLDGKFSDALRNTLFGSFGEDLGTRNMFRSADVGMMDYASLAECYGVRPNASVMRKKAAMKDSPTLVLLKENAEERGAAFGPVNKAILTDQFHRILFGTGGNWYGKDPSAIAGWEAEVSGCTLAKVFDDNLGGGFSGDAFRA